MKLLNKLFKIIFLALMSVVVLVILFHGYKDKPVQELKIKYAPAPSAFVLIDGMDVHYRDEGNP